MARSGCSSAALGGSAARLDRRACGRLLPPAAHLRVGPGRLGAARSRPPAAQRVAAPAAVSGAQVARFAGLFDEDGDGRRLLCVELEKTARNTGPAVADCVFDESLAIDGESVVEDGLSRGTISFEMPEGLK